MTAPFTTARKTWQCSQGKWDQVHGPTGEGGLHVLRVKTDATTRRSIAGHRCACSVFVYSPGQIPQKNPSAAPTSCPLTALHTFRGFRTSITGGCPVGEGGTPHSFPYPGGLHLEPVTRQDPNGFGVSRLEKPRPHSYTPITRPRHWPLSAAHSAPCGRGRHRPATARQPQELTQKGRAPQNPV